MQLSYYRSRCNWVTISVDATETVTGECVHTHTLLWFVKQFCAWPEQRPDRYWQLVRYLQLVEAMFRIFELGKLASKIKKCLCLIHRTWRVFLYCGFCVVSCTLLSFTSGTPEARFRFARWTANKQNTHTHTHTHIRGALVHRHNFAGLSSRMYAIMCCRGMSHTGPNW